MTPEGNKEEVHRIRQAMRYFIKEVVRIVAAQISRDGKPDPAPDPNPFHPEQEPGTNTPPTDR